MSSFATPAPGHGLSRCISRNHRSALVSARAWLLVVLLLVTHVMSAVPGAAAFGNSALCVAQSRDPTCRCRLAEPHVNAAPVHACPLCADAASDPTPPSPPLASRACCGCCIQESSPDQPSSEPARPRAAAPDRLVVLDQATPTVAPTADTILRIVIRTPAPGHWLTRDGITHARLCRWTT